MPKVLERSLSLNHHDDCVDTKVIEKCVHGHFFHENLFFFKKCSFGLPNVKSRRYGFG